MTELATMGNPYLSGEYAPVQEESTFQELQVIGELPRELFGSFVRNSPNPRFQPQGNYHWFDGDGMVTGLSFENGKASFKNRYIHTRGFELESKNQKAMWKGILEPLDFKNPYGPIKNTSNTDLVWFSGKLLSLWWLGDKAYELKLPNLDTLGQFDFNGKLTCGMASHPKVDPVTKELMFFDFATFPKPPFLQYGVASADGSSIKVVPIELPGPRLLHDIAITEKHTLFLDMPLYYDPIALARGVQKVVFNRDTPSRFGIIPRHGNSTDIRWFESSPCYIYHTVNAYEEGEEIILTGCRIEDPLVDPKKEKNPNIPLLNYLQLLPRFHRWRFNLVTGKSTEEELGDIYTEFPRINDQMLGRKTQFSYHPRIARQPTLLFDALIKEDCEKGVSTTFEYGQNCFGGEAVFAPRPHANSEDDGWVMTFVYDRNNHTSECIILDAQDFGAGPIARIPIPVRVPIGFHATWVPGDEILV